MSARVDETDVARDLVEELLRTAFSIGDALASLVEALPADAYPGEDHGDVLIEMAAGSSRPAVDAAGEATCRAATALIGAVRDRIIGDLREAARLASERE